jgi:TonB family protein
MFLRAVQIILIITAGIIFVVLGYKLFLYGVDRGRGKLRSKSETYKLIFSGSGPGLFFMILGGLIVLFSIYSVSIALETGTLKNELSTNSEDTFKPLSADLGQADTTKIAELFSEASFAGISTRPASPLRNYEVKPKNKRKIERTLNAAEFGIQGSKSVYRNENELSRVINKHNKAIEYCYKKETRNNPKLKGDLEVEFSIEYNGRVKDVRIVRSSVYSKKIEKCISDRIRGWRFKAIDQQEGDVKVRQKYIFG